MQTAIENAKEKNEAAGMMGAIKQSLLIKLEEQISEKADALEALN